MPDRPTLLLEREVAKAICEALRAGDSTGGYVADPDGDPCIIDGHFDMLLVARALLASSELSVHLVENIKNRIPG